MCHGCFDILHVGHVRLLKEAARMGDRLVVSLLSDRYITLYKGAERPIHRLEARAEVLRELRCVSQVVVVDAPAVEAVQKTILDVRPHIYVKGDEYEGRLPEQKFCEENGIKVRFVKMMRGFSTTAALRRMTA